MKINLIAELILVTLTLVIFLFGLLLSNKFLALSNENVISLIMMSFVGLGVCIWNIILTLREMER